GKVRAETGSSEVWTEASGPGCLPPFSRRLTSTVRVTPVFTSRTVCKAISRLGCHPEAPVDLNETHCVDQPV
ncbi:hypothetical protein LEMLEM_LOCUS15167, partial [Lemmus lemmus]